ncbi:MAG: hypothetical protein LBQ83_08115 [Candidatus Margulisbacteria bacterium]|jgi:hypothetical protein|nr:hypothetical protein [Candidatus Margulisiibacteriota bacterium]
MENTQVDLQVKPQPKGPLPDVRLKPAEKKEGNVSELVTHLVLQKYNSLTGKLQGIKGKLLALPFIQKGLQLKNTAEQFKAKAEELKSKAEQLKTQYTNQEQNKAKLEQLKTGFGAQIKVQLQKLEEKTKLRAKLSPLLKIFSKRALLAKIAEAKEDLQEIRQKGQDVIASTLKNKIEQKSAAPGDKQ